MIEPTDEMVRAFREGYAPYDRPLDSDAVEVGLAAVLEIVERDYDMRERVVVHLATCIHCRIPDIGPDWPPVHRLGCPNLAPAPPTSEDP